jgi:hypothetical protein
VKRIKVEAMWTVSTSNRKTGIIPTQYVGLNKQETWASCEGCNLRPDADGGCYAWAGNVVRGANSVRKATLKGRPASLTAVLKRTPRLSRAVRFGAIGDPSRLKRESLLADLKTARTNGFKVLAYTHHWASEPLTGSLKREMLASCETTQQVEQAQSEGWLVALAGPDSAPGMVTCPNYARPEIQCNRCGLCDVPTLRKTGYKGVVFPAHGNGKRKLPMAGA